MEEFSSKDMDHLGPVGGMCNELELVKMIDQIIFPDSRSGLQQQTHKTINWSRAFLAEEISDDCLGRALDRIYEANCERIFSAIASKALTRFNVEARFRHLDTTSMSVHGEYEERLGLIEFGYSKDNNPNLKQFIISLMSSPYGDVPLIAQTISGNTSDKKCFREVLKALKKEVKESEATTHYAADSALYTRETLEEISSCTKWVIRVPENINASKELIKEISKEEKGVVAFGLVMCLCLLVYILSQRKLKMRLIESNETVPDQKGKAIKNPRMRWIYQIFEGIHVIYRMKTRR